MTSTCPGCSKQVEHEDHLFEVECSCGNRFNPFMLNSGMDIPPMEPGVGMGMMDEHVEEPPPPPPPPTVDLEPPSEAAPESPQDSLVSFEESAAAFEEVREFGETLVAGNLPEIKSPPPSPHLPQSSRPAAGDCLMTAGDQLAGYAVESYLSPLSVVNDLNLKGGDPLKPAFDVLWNQAKTAGANGVVALRWAMTPDGTKVLLSGTPVRVTKQG